MNRISNYLDYAWEVAESSRDRKLRRSYLKFVEVPTLGNFKRLVGRIDDLVLLGYEDGGNKEDVQKIVIKQYATLGTLLWREIPINEDLSRLIGLEVRGAVTGKRPMDPDDVEFLGKMESDYGKTGFRKIFRGYGSFGLTAGDNVLITCVDSGSEQGSPITKMLSVMEPNLNFFYNGLNELSHDTEIYEVFGHPFKYGSFTDISTYTGFMDGGMKFKLIIDERCYFNTVMSEEVVKKLHTMTSGVDGYVVLNIKTFAIYANLNNISIYFDLMGLHNSNFGDGNKFVFFPKKL